MKIIAAIMDVVHVKKNDKIKQFFINKVKKYLVYDPSKVSGWDIERRKGNENRNRING